MVEMVGSLRGWMVGVSGFALGGTSRGGMILARRADREKFSGVGFGERGRRGSEQRAADRGQQSSSGQRKHAVLERTCARLWARWSSRGRDGSLLALRALWFNAYGKGLRADQGPTSEEPLSASASAAAEGWSW